MSRHLLPWASSFVLVSACTDVDENDNPSTTTVNDEAASGDGDGGEGTGLDATTGESEFEGFCAQQCIVDSDCIADGMDIGAVCIDGLCLFPDGQCHSDEQCVAAFSGWAGGIPCTAGGGECVASMGVCLDVEGEGHCATAPSMLVDCASLLLEEIEVVDIEGNPATVCGNPDLVCTEDSVCLDPCESDADCPQPDLPICNVATGMCGCGTDSDCATLQDPTRTVCIDGVCGCDSDQQCIDANAGDVCTSLHLCGCSGDAACDYVSSNFDNEMIGCVPIG